MEKKKKKKGCVHVCVVWIYIYNVTRSYPNQEIEERKSNQKTEIIGNPKE